MIEFTFSQIFNQIDWEWVGAAHEGITSALLMMLVFQDARMALGGRHPSQSSHSEKTDYNPELEVRNEMYDHLKDAILYYKRRKVCFSFFS